MIYKILTNHSLNKSETRVERIDDWQHVTNTRACHRAHCKCIENNEIPGGGQTEIKRLSTSSSNNSDIKFFPLLYICPLKKLNFPLIHIGVLRYSGLVSTYFCDIVLPAIVTPESDFYFEIIKLWNATFIIIYNNTNKIFLSPFELTPISL